MESSAADTPGPSESAIQSIGTTLEEPASSSTNIPANSGDIEPTTTGTSTEQQIPTNRGNFPNTGGTLQSESGGR